MGLTGGNSGSVPDLLGLPAAEPPGSAPAALVSGISGISLKCCDFQRSLRDPRSGKGDVSEALLTAASRAGADACLDLSLLVKMTGFGDTLNNEKVRDLKNELCRNLGLCCHSDAVIVTSPGKNVRVGELGQTMRILR